MFSSFFSRSFIDYEVSLLRLGRRFSSLHVGQRIQIDQRCLQSTGSSVYSWNFVRTPTENQTLFASLIGDSGPSIPSKGSDSAQDLYNCARKLVDSSNGQFDDIHKLQDQIIGIIKKGDPGCLRQIAALLRANFGCLISLTAPFDIHWQFIKKLDSLLVNYCKGIKKNYWFNPEFIDDCLQLTIDLYKFSPPTAMAYSDCLVQNILGKVNDLTKEQFLRLMFCCILIRRKMSPQQVDWCQTFIDKYLDSFSLANLSLILVTFHKTQTYLVDDSLHKKILNKVSSEAENERDATLRSSLLKGINYSLVMADSKLAEKLIDSFMKLDNLSIYNFIHLNEFSVKQKIYCPKLIDKSISILENAIEHLREKDVERILKCATAFNHFQPPCPNIDKIIHQLDSTIDESSPIELEKTIPSLLRSLFLLNIYPPKMIRYILSTDWCKKINFYGKDVHLYYWLLMTIRDCLSIDRYPEFEGKLQNLDKVYAKGSQTNQLRVPIGTIIRHGEGKTSMNNKNLGQLYDATVDAFPDRIVRFGYFLSTSLTPDLMITTNPKHVRLLKGPIRTPNCFVKAYVIVYQGKQMYIDQKFCEISGHYRLRERLFQRLGLTVINVPFYELYHKIDEYSNDDLVDYIKRRIKKFES